tara:strand:- start:2454 stop:2714 length:261 start_codon:yes stop_codon:yes gene_type:complete
MGAHSIPVDTSEAFSTLSAPRDITFTLEERGYLKEMLHTYKSMFAEQMVAMKFNNSTDMQKREVFREKQLFYAQCIMEKLLLADSQ